MIFSFYDIETGLFTGRQLRAKRFALAVMNCPEREGFVEGAHDPDNKRFDFEAVEVVDYRPPAPDERYKWVNGKNGKWVLRARFQRAENQSNRGPIRDPETRGATA